jgi:hypothetical protein
MVVASGSQPNFLLVYCINVKWLGAEIFGVWKFKQIVKEGKNIFRIWKYKTGYSSALQSWPLAPHWLASTVGKAFNVWL